MAVSWFLLLCVGVMVVVLLAVNIYMLVHWSHPDDKNEAYFPKALVVCGHENNPGQNETYAIIMTSKHTIPYLYC